MKKRILVTGGCGFIGSNAVHELFNRGYHVTIVDDMSTGSLENIAEIPTRVVPVEILPMYENLTDAIKNDKGKMLVLTGDFAHKAILEKIKTKSYDAILHFAANPRVEYSVNYPVETHESNVYKTVALFKYAADSNTRVVFSSSCAIYGDASNIPTHESEIPNPNSPYGLQKLECEQYATLFNKLYNLDIVCLRYFNVYGPRQLGGSAYSTAVSSWCAALHNGNPLRSDGDGTQTRDMIFVGDIVKGNILAIEREENFSADMINIATGTSISNNEIIDMFKLTNPSLEIVHAPERPGDVKHTKADIGKMNSLLNMTDTTPFSVGLEKTFEWWDSLEVADG